MPFTGQQESVQLLSPAHVGAHPRSASQTYHLRAAHSQAIERGHTAQAQAATRSRALAQRAPRLRAREGRSPLPSSSPPLFLYLTPASSPPSSYPSHFLPALPLPSLFLSSLPLSSLASGPAPLSLAALFPSHRCLSRWPLSHYSPLPNPSPTAPIVNPPDLRCRSYALSSFDSPHRPSLYPSRPFHLPSLPSPSLCHSSYSFQLHSLLPPVPSRKVVSGDMCDSAKQSMKECFLALDIDGSGRVGCSPRHSLPLPPLISLPPSLRLFNGQQSHSLMYSSRCDMCHPNLATFLPDLLYILLPCGCVLFRLSFLSVYPAFSPFPPHPRCHEKSLRMRFARATLPTMR